VQIADRIAYINHDIDDSVRAGLLSIGDLPAAAIELLGTSSRQRINNLVLSVLKNSADYESVRLGPAEFEALHSLRDYLFTNIYRNSVAANLEAGLTKHLNALFDYYLGHMEEIPEFMREAAGGDDKRAVCDYIAGMSDDYALRCFDRLGIRK